MAVVTVSTISWVHVGWCQCFCCSNRYDGVPCLWWNKSWQLEKKKKRGGQSGSWKGTNVLYEVKSLSTLSHLSPITFTGLIWQLPLFPLVPCSPSLRTTASLFLSSSLCVSSSSYAHPLTSFLLRFDQGEQDFSSSTYEREETPVLVSISCPMSHVSVHFFPPISFPLKYSLSTLLSHSFMSFPYKFPHSVKFYTGATMHAHTSLCVIQSVWPGSAWQWCSLTQQESCFWVTQANLAWRCHSRDNRSIYVYMCE